MIRSIINREDLFPKPLVSVRAPMSVLGRQEVKDGLGVVEWHMPTSIIPMKYAISVRSDDNLAKMISKAGNFVINFMGQEHKSIVLSCENQDSLFVDLFSSLGISKSEADMVESPRVKEAKAFLECEVEQELDSGDHTLFLGRVVGPRV
jgi:flavin reductase (DIM6/NTAB) family NADH-FMN oxidoreductase RutF